MRILAIAVLLLLAGCALTPEYPPGVPPPTATEARQALRDALALAAHRAIARASRIDGFYADPRIRIDIAHDSRTVQKRLRQVGLGAHVDRSVLQLNRIAEQTAPEARPVFSEAIAALEIDDPFDLIDAGDHAGTRELMDQAYERIYAAYLPIVSAALSETSAPAYHRKLIERYNSLPLSFDIDIELDQYLARSSVDGLFLLMREEEARLRETPSARGTQAIDRVFRMID